MAKHYSNTNNPVDFPKSESAINDNRSAGKSLIKHLAMSTDIWCDQNVAQGSPMYNNQWEEKFAELIVDECCAKLLDMDSKANGNHNYYKHTVIELKRYFRED